MKIKHIINYLRAPQLWICIFIAILSWGLNRLSKTITTNVKVPVKIIGVSSNDKIDNSTDLNLEVKLKSTGYNIIYYRYIIPKDYFSITIADIDMTKNKDSLYYTLNRNSLERSLSKLMGTRAELISIEDRNITVGAKHYRQKTIPVHLNTSIDFGGKLMQVGDIKINPKEIIVGGTSTIIDTLSSVVTKKIDVNTRKNNFTGKIDLETNPHLVYSTNEIYYTINTEEYSEKKESYIVNVNGLNKGNLVILPRTVTLTLNVPKNTFYSFDKKSISVFVDYNEDKITKNDEYLVEYKTNNDRIKVVNIEPKFVTILKSVK